MRRAGAQAGVGERIAYLLRREPEVMPVMWQGMLRMERVVLRKERRFMKKVRKHFRRR